MKRNRITLFTAIAITCLIIAVPLTANAVVNWTRGNSGNHVLPRSAPGSGAWDEAEIFRPMVIIDGGAYVMWYSGLNAGETTNYKIGRAVSTDGITWTKDADPVLEPTGSGWESVHVAAAWVIKMPDGENPYKMWYTGTNDPTREAAQIGFAESADGITWTRHGSNPVLLPGVSGDWDDLGVAGPVVLYDPTSATPYKMWYKGWRADQSGYLGYATSTDGITWTKYNNPGTNSPEFVNSDPVLQWGPQGAFDGNDLGLVSIVKEGDLYRMWYAGYPGDYEEFPAEYKRDRIAFAYSIDGINWRKYNGNPVFMESNDDLKFDGQGVYDPMVIKDNNNNYKMWYVGSFNCISETCDMAFGYATSQAYGGPAPQLNDVNVFTLHDYIDGVEKRLIGLSMAPEGASVLDTNEASVTGPVNWVFSDNHLRLRVHQMQLSGTTEVLAFDSYGGDYTFTYRTNNDSQPAATKSLTLVPSEIPYPVDGEAGLARHIDVGGTISPNTAAYISGVTPIFRWKPYLGDSYYYRVRVSDWKRQTVWFQSDPLLGSSKVSGYLQAQVPAENPLKPNTPYKWVVEVLDTNDTWTAHNRSRSQEWTFYTGTDTGSGFLPNISNIYFFGQRSFMNGGQTIAGANVVKLAPWEIAYLYVEDEGLNSFPFDTDTDAFTNYVMNFAYNKSMLGLPSEGMFTFYVSDGTTAAFQAKDYNGDDAVPFVTRGSMTPVDNAYVMTDQPTLSWWAQGGTSYEYRATIETWNGIMVWRSNWIPDPAVGELKSVNVPAGVLRGGVYRWYVDVSDTNRSNMTRSQMLALTLAAGEGPGAFDELAADFGSGGLYHYAGGTWARLSKSDPEDMCALGNALYVDLGPSGLYRFAGGVWTKVSGSNPEGMVAVGSDLYIDFGSALGLYKYNGTTLTRVNKTSPEGMCAVGNALYADFGSTGLYRYSAGAWAKVSGSNPEGMVAVGSDLYIDFGSALGLYKYNGTTLTRVNKTSPEGMCAVGDVLYADFGSVGLYRYNAGAWAKVSGSDPEGMVAVGSDLYIDFGSALGLYKYNGTALTRVSKTDAEGLCAVGSDLYADFGAIGLYRYSGGVWTRASISNVESMTGVNLQ